jgi:hypothetical protein
MTNFFLWFSFIGAWFLFAGPIYQAVLELQDEDIEIERIRATGSRIQRSPRISAWWWLLPPVRIWKQIRQGKQDRQRIFELLSPEDAQAMLSFNSKATAWLYVAFGGFCIASKETYELCKHNDWGTAVLALLVFGMLGLSIANLLYRLRRAANFVKEWVDPPQ